MYFKKNKFVMPSMQFFSHLSGTAHCAIGSCKKQIVHNSRSIEKVISCSNRMMSSVLFKKTPHHNSSHRIMQQMNTGHSNVSTVMFVFVEIHIK